MLMKNISSIQLWRRSLLTITLVPILLLGHLFINNAHIFDSKLDGQNSILQFFNLPYLLSQFDSIDSLPTLHKFIGKICSGALIGLFYVWLILFTTNNYLKLSHQIGSKFYLLFELILISIVYVNFVTPSSLIFSIAGFLIIGFNLALIILYWIYDFKTKK